MLKKKKNLKSQNFITITNKKQTSVTFNFLLLKVTPKQTTKKPSEIKT